MAVCIGAPTCKCSSYKEDVTERPVKASVGAGGTNLRIDAVVVQQLLNGVPITDGGPAEQLKVDGIVGPKTIAAIRVYQKRVLPVPDGRIDPAGPTISHLTGFICTSSSVPAGPIGKNVPTAGAGDLPDDELRRKLLEGMTEAEFLKLHKDDADARMKEVLPGLQRLRWKFTRTDKPLVALVQKHFGTNSERVTDGDIDHVRQVIRDTEFYMTSHSNFVELDPVHVPDALAYTVRGGDKLPLNKFQIYRDIHNRNRVHKYPGQTIWLTDMYIIQRRPERCWTMLHEFAHFVGKRDGHFDTIDDYGAAFEGRFTKLSKFQRLHNAETVSMFLVEYCLGTDALTSTPRLAAKLQYAIQPPFVLSDGSIVMQK